MTNKCCIKCEVDGLPKMSKTRRYPSTTVKLLILRILLEVKRFENSFTVDDAFEVIICDVGKRFDIRDGVSLPPLLLLDILLVEEDAHRPETGTTSVWIGLPAVREAAICLLPQR